jgi:DNA-binding NtrC family response regulator
MSNESLTLALRALERRLIETALLASRGNLTQAAAAVGASRRDLYRRVQRLNIPLRGPGKMNGK